MNKNNKNQGQNKELIYLGAIISTNDPISILTNIDIEYFTVNEIIQTINLCIDENKIVIAAEKLFTRAKIQYEKFITGKTDDEIKEALKKIKNELYLNTEEGIRNNCVFSDLFDERLAVEVDEQYVTTGIEPFDHYLTGGLMKKTLTGIQAATGQGKTTMLLTLGCNILKKGYNVCFVNLEMNENEFNNNILSGLSDKFSYSDIKMNNNLKNPNFRKELQEEIKSKNIGKTCLIINRTGEYEAMSPKLIEKWILQEEERKGIKFDVVLIDYLFLLKTASKNNYTQQTFEFLQKVTQEAHMMSQNNNWAVLSVFQENREGAKNTDKSGTEGMAGSYNSLHDMDNYFKFHQSKSKDDLIIVNPLKLRQYGGLKNGEGPFTMKYTKTEKIRYIVFTTILTMIAYMMRMNSLIFIIATVIYLILNIFKNIKEKSWKKNLLSVAIIIMYVVISIFPSSIVSRYYLDKYNLERNKTYPSIGYVLMAMQEGPRANGWYNESTREKAFDRLDNISDEYKHEIKERIEYFLQNPGYTIKFYIDKITSMWAENTYSAIRNSEVNGNLDNLVKPLEFYQKVLLTLTCVCSLIVLIQNRKNLSLDLIFLITIFIGGFAFHILWEAKSRYIIPYILVLIPISTIVINKK